MKKKEINYAKHMDMFLKRVTPLSRRATDRFIGRDYRKHCPHRR
jgi:hypothetical protein